MIPKLMFAADCEGDLAWIPMPGLFSRKLDGIRCTPTPEGALSRNFKPLPNRHVQCVLASLGGLNLDGEIIVGSPFSTDPLDSVMSRTSSGVMSVEGTPDFTYWVFDDYTNTALPFECRLQEARRKVESINEPWLKVVEHRWIFDYDTLLAWESEVLAEGYEGLMRREPAAPYKFGYSTLRENWLVKIKRFKDSEFVISQIERGSRNTNTATRNAAGKLERSSAKAGKVPTDMLGGLVGFDVKTGAKVRVAPGVMSHEQRRYWLAHPQELLGKVGKYKFFPSGTKDAPRFPTWLGLRDPSDM